MWKKVKLNGDSQDTINTMNKESRKKKTLFLPFTILLVVYTKTIFHYNNVKSVILSKYACDTCSV